MEALMERKTPHPTLRESSAGTSSLQHRLLRGYLHKTSNSLCGIKGYASLIAERGLAAGDNSVWARKIISEVENMERLFASVGDLTGGRAASPAGADLEQAFLEAVAHLQGGLNGARLEIGALPAARLLLPAADLRQVVREILLNSSEARPGACITVSADPCGRGNLSLILGDDAGGIPGDLFRQVRDPFVTTKPGHLGIGLARVETIMDMHELDWALTSDPGRGTTVSLEVAALD